jgi:hypothetical protein
LDPVVTEAWTNNKEKSKMAVLVSTSPGDIDVVASRLKSEAFTNMNGGRNPSAIQTNGKDFQGKPLPYGTVAKSIKAEKKAQLAKNYADVPDWQQRKISAAPLRPAHAQRSPNTRVVIPQKLSYGAPVRPSVRPSKLGIFKR